MIRTRINGKLYAFTTRNGFRACFQAAAIMATYLAACGCGEILTR